MGSSSSLSLTSRLTGTCSQLLHISQVTSTFSDFMVELRFRIVRSGKNDRIVFGREQQTTATRIKQVF
jgi:hypothetical protein